MAGPKSRVLTPEKPRARRARSRDALKLKILQVLTRKPGLGSVAVADELGEHPFLVTKAVHELMEDGLLEIAMCIPPGPCPAERGSAVSASCTPSAR